MSHVGEGLTILRAGTHETELGDHDFCLSRSVGEGEKEQTQLKHFKT